MLGTCVSLNDCERILKRELPKLKFIGELELSSDDVQKLNNFIISEFASSHDTVSVIKRNQASLVTFLVWQGILGYEAGDYWTGVHKTLGLEDPALENTLGEAFVSFLKEAHLPSPDFVGALKFVTPHSLARWYSPKPFRSVF